MGVPSGHTAKIGAGKNATNIVGAEVFPSSGPPRRRSTMRRFGYDVPYPQRRRRHRPQSRRTGIVRTSPRSMVRGYPGGLPACARRPDDQLILPFRESGGLRRAPLNPLSSALITVTEDDLLTVINGKELATTSRGAGPGTGRSDQPRHQPGD